MARNSVDEVGAVASSGQADVLAFILGLPAEAGLPRPTPPLTVAAGIRARPENIDHEAHLSTKETQASPYARVSCPYAHTCG